MTWEELGTNLAMQEIQRESIHQFANEVMRDAFQDEWIEDMTWIGGAVESPRCECEQCTEHLFNEIWDRVEKWRVPQEDEPSS